MLGLVGSRTVKEEEEVVDGQLNMWSSF